MRLLGLLCLAPALALAAAPTEPPPRLRIAQGALLGTREHGARAFLGIPYAAPPVGALRWRPPQPATGWQGLRDATRFGPNCMQDHPDGSFGPWTSEYLISGPTSEDCLLLNVWTPERSADGPLPVLVWIHGGGFGSGSGAIPIYNGARLAAQGIVVVTINYRVGALGFLAHPQLSAESPERTSGNQGLLDQVEALRWVRDNISHFGGDPARVTIAGQSAGAASVLDLMASPKARGLFARAIAQSGAGMGVSAPPLAQAEQDGVSLQRAAGAASIDALRALPAEAARKLVVPGKTAWGAGLPFVPTLDGVVLAADAARGDAPFTAQVPLLTGFTADEARVVDPHPASIEEFTTGLQQRYGEFAQRLLELYPHATPAEAADSGWLLPRDRYMASLVRWCRQRAAAGGGPTWGYFFQHPVPGPRAGLFGTFHTAEVPYVFGVLEAPGRTFGPADQAVSRQVQQAWLAFIRGGAPALEAGEAWPACGAANDMRVMGLGDEAGPRDAVSSRLRLDAWLEYADAGGTLSMF